MSHGDTLRFRLQNGQVRTLVLEDTSAATIETVEPGAIIYEFRCRLTIDGEPIELVRYASCQEAFYDPYVINGMRIWPITVDAVFEMLPHGGGWAGNRRHRPRKDARLAVQDATLRICPDELFPWMDESEDFIDVARCYTGEDTYLGTYIGRSLHRGLDINHPAGSTLLAPMDFDTQAYFNSLERGHKNNRWRGIRRWDNGDIWALQTHHLIDLLVPENVPLKRGTRYATSAGVAVALREHTHFEFRVVHSIPFDPTSPDIASIHYPLNFDDGRGDQVMNLDPWIVFWQIFEDRKRREQRLLADMTPPGPAQTGQTVQFSAAPSQPAEDADSLQYHWTFGDGSWAIGRDPTHRYAKPGIYPVTLVVTRGNESAARTMHLTVSGDPIDQPVLRIQADDPSFRIRPAWAANVYGQYTQPLPHTLRIHTHPGASTPLRRELQAVNIGSGTLSPLKVLSVEPDAAADWLRIETLGQGNNQRIRVTIDPTNLKPGDYASTVRVATLETMHAPQSFRVALHVHAEAPPADQIIGVQDAGFYATPWFWVGHRFSRAPADRRGHNGFYLTNGYRPTAGEIVRFTPHLADGTYEVSLLEKSPYPSDSEFNVRIRHADGESLLRIRPSESRSLGTYRFEVASPGFVELLAEDASGLLVADALRFRRVD